MTETASIVGRRKWRMWRCRYAEEGCPYASYLCDDGIGCDVRTFVDGLLKELREENANLRREVEVLRNLLGECMEGVSRG